METYELSMEHYVEIICKTIKTNRSGLFVWLTFMPYLRYYLRGVTDFDAIFARSYS